VQTASLARSLSWPTWQVENFYWTIWWTAGVVIAFGVARFLTRKIERKPEWLDAFPTLIILLAMKFVLIDSLGWRALVGVTTAVPVAINLQAATAVVLISALLIIGLLDATTRRKLVLLAAVLVLFTASLEIDRGIQTIALSGALIWPTWQAEGLALDICWTIGLIGMFQTGRFLTRNEPKPPAWLGCFPWLMALLACKWILIDAIGPRMFHGALPVDVGTNLQAIAGGVCIAGLVTLSALALDPRWRRPLILLGVILLLCLTSLEIDRAFERVKSAGIFADPARARQMALSIFWSAFAVAAVGAGFATRFAQLRYLGLALLAITLMKIVVIDMRQVSTGYRILSFMGVGLLMLGTSVIYGKVSPKLLGKVADPA